jgi:hypothetical protein
VQHTTTLCSLTRTSRKIPPRTQRDQASLRYTKPYQFTLNYVNERQSPHSSICGYQEEKSAASRSHNGCPTSASRANVCTAECRRWTPATSRCAAVLAKRFHVPSCTVIQGSGNVPRWQRCSGTPGLEWSYAGVKIDSRLISRRLRSVEVPSRR